MPVSPAGSRGPSTGIDPAPWRKTILRRGEQGEIMCATSERLCFETLEEPGEDEYPVVINVQGSVAEAVLELLRRLAQRSR